MQEQQMIDSKTRALKLLQLCNKFKDRVAFYNEESFYEYANYCWHLAYETGECDVVYEDGGDNPYYDLVGLQIENEYACIPVPLLTPTLIAEIFKQHPSTVEKYEHDRKIVDDESLLLWEVLIPELVFLSLKPHIYNDEILYVVGNTEFKKIPSNPTIYDARGCAYMPVHDESYRQWFKYKDYVFKSWKVFDVYFEKV